MRALFIPLAALALVAAASKLPHAARADRAPLAIEILPHDNVRAAGRLHDGVLSIGLVAGAGTWFPEGDAAPGREVYAFGESTDSLRNPGPLIRVVAGTEVHATVRNALEGQTLTVHGLHARPGGAAPLVIAPGESASVRFRLTEPGTYFYWGSTRGATTTVGRFGKETQLAGALIVDPPGGMTTDHVFMIGVEDDSADLPGRRQLRAAVVNGRSWPNGPRQTVHTGDTVRMRWINVTDRYHPMHLHGFYFQVHSRGASAQDTLYEPAARRIAVTELMAPGTTMGLSWVPERPGNWLLHCHMAEHMSPHLRGAAASHAAHPVENHSMQAMAGIVTGWHVLSREAEQATTAPDAASPRIVRLLVQAGRARPDARRVLGFVLPGEDGESSSDSVRVPGPPLVLTRGEPVQITVVNRLDEPTSIHWHGIELDSYYDGVSGWSGAGRRLSPQVAPGDSFAVRFTPPRAGTFIYHSHFDEERQLSSGMFGPLLVLEPGQRFDPDTDRIWVLSQLARSEGDLVLFNGSGTPIEEMVRGRTYRIRLINISPNIPLNVFVLDDSLPAEWRAVAKDGADLPPHQATMRPARQMIGVGEVYDFEFTPPARDSLRLVLRGPFGPIRATGVIRLSPGTAGNGKGETGNGTAGKGKRNGANR